MSLRDEVIKAMGLCDGNLTLEGHRATAGAAIAAVKAHLSKPENITAEMILSANGHPEWTCDAIAAAIAAWEP